VILLTHGLDLGLGAYFASSFIDQHVYYPDPTFLAAASYCFVLGKPLFTDGTIATCVGYL